MSPDDVAEKFLCVDCSIDTINEYYMIDQQLWIVHGAGRGMLCIGCLEIRMGRHLTSVDFTDCLITKEHLAHKSIRLLNRLGHRGIVI